MIDNKARKMSLAEMDNVELDNAVLDKVAGGGCYNDNNFEPCNNFMVA